MSEEYNKEVGIFSIFMDNLHPATIQAQQAVVKKFNKSNWGVHTVRTNQSHGATMDWIWNMVSDQNSQLYGTKIVIFLDIDAIPLNDKAIDQLVNFAKVGHLIGNVQRSGHIENNEHLFVAPSVCAMSLDTYNYIGRPSAEPTARGDVGEEYTYAAEDHKISPMFNYPLKWEHPVRRMDWETDRSATWKLSAKRDLGGLNEYAVGTTFGYIGTEEVPMFYHNFQIFHPGHQEIFIKKCEEVYNG